MPKLAATLRRAAARLAELTQPAPHIRDRWNIEEDGDDLLICFNQHEKGDKCRYVRYVPELNAEQPAPLALSPEDAQAWDRFSHAIKSKTPPWPLTSIDRAILAVDALLRKRVQRLTDEELDLLWREACAKHDETRMFVREFARAVEAALGIGEGS